MWNEHPIGVALSQSAREHLKCLMNLLRQDFSHTLSLGRGNDCKAFAFELLHLCETAGLLPDERIPPDGCSRRGGELGLIGCGIAESCCLIYLIRNAESKCKSAGTHHAASAIYIGRERGERACERDATSFAAWIAGLYSYLGCKRNGKLTFCFIFCFFLPSSW